MTKTDYSKEGFRLQTEEKGASSVACSQRFLQETCMAEIFNKSSAMEMVGNDEELFSVLLQSFADVDFSPDTLSSLIKSRKKEEAASYVHRVKGAARQLALEKLAQSGQLLEDVLREKQTGNTDSLKEDFCLCYTESLAVIKDELTGR